MNTQIQAMRKLGFTDEEIAEVMEADKKIDQGEKLFELTAEQEKASRQGKPIASREPMTLTTQAESETRKSMTTKRKL